MLRVSINEPELRSLEYIRIALSEPTPDLREKAIANAKQEMVTLRLTTLNEKFGTAWTSEPQNAEFVQWIAQTSAERHEASYEFSQTGRRYEDRNERRLNVAEHIGKLIWLSIQDKRFEGVQTDEGLLKQVSNQARDHSISGAKDKDTLREIWKTYRGIVHLGMALDYCDEHPASEQNVLHLAEEYRKSLSHFCPKGTKTPYVLECEQIKFVYCSRAWGPRFQNRGLPFGVN
ncbi:hypothetical protein EYC08_11685 [Tabrizicola sp. WMC-M-20]|nr:hypothetical protein EYC08_11685 [Tabrizicola sp. WMC-M-20]